MNYYLIDLENVHSQGLEGADLLSHHERIVIFYSDASCLVTRAVSEMIRNSNATTLFRMVNAHSKNALDFQLSVYVGQILNLPDTEKIFIISLDKGYHAIESVERSQEIQIRQYPSILECLYQQERPVFTSAKNVKIVDLKTMLGMDRIYRQLAEKYEVNFKSLKEILRKGLDIREFYTELTHTFGRQKGRELYRNLKDTYSSRA